MGEVYQRISEARKRVVQSFFISRTGTNPSGDILSNPERANQYIESGKDFSDLEWQLLDNKLLQASKNCNTISELYEEIKPFGYANCTTQAACLCSELNDLGIESRLLSIVGQHHVTLAKGDDDYTVVISDPWADVQFNVQLNQKIDCLDNLSMESLKQVIEAISTQYKGFNDLTSDTYMKNFTETASMFFMVSSPNVCLESHSVSTESSPGYLFHDHEVKSTSIDDNNSFCVIS
ncbi:hypothetical protein L3V79_09090 [Thiotrichales bacterium 19S9-12]|nr:hypothetical protein [Thiotrichales bacterium 19S9-11]MCF6812512.1 hypothetical protein [Thiotrichales bacterium 19S9-12]